MTLHFPCRSHRRLTDLIYSLLFLPVSWLSSVTWPYVARTLSFTALYQYVRWMIYPVEWGAYHSMHMEKEIPMGESNSYIWWNPSLQVPSSQPRLIWGSWTKCATPSPSTIKLMEMEAGESIRRVFYMGDCGCLMGGWVKHSDQGQKGCDLST